MFKRLKRGGWQWSLSCHPTSCVLAAYCTDTPGMVPDRRKEPANWHRFGGWRSDSAFYRRSAARTRALNSCSRKRSAHFRRKKVQPSSVRAFSRCRSWYSTSAVGL